MLGKELHEHWTVVCRAILRVALASATLARTIFRLRRLRRGIVLTHEEGSESTSSLGVEVVVVEVGGSDDDDKFAADDEEGKVEEESVLQVTGEGDEEPWLWESLALVSNNMDPLEIRKLLYTSFCCRILSSRSWTWARSHIHREAIAPRSTAHRQDRLFLLLL